jgi:hypothetical protein
MSGLNWRPTLALTLLICHHFVGIFCLTELVGLSPKDAFFLPPIHFFVFDFKEKEGVWKANLKIEGRSGNSVP